jgi:hypothetical protein
MRPATRPEGRHLVVVPANADRPPAIDPGRLEDLVTDVRAVRARLLDAWEATALVESLGYSDARVQREFGFRNTLEAGEYVFKASADLQGNEAGWAPIQQPIVAIVGRSVASTLIYAVPWMAIFVAQKTHPEATQLSGVLASPLALALMFSLVWSGGFVQAIVRRGEFYVGVRQLGLARDVVGVLLRIGVALTIIVAGIGMVVGRYLRLFSWPALVIGADAFVIMSVLWMVCSTFAIRRQQWRVAAAFLVGFAGYIVARSFQADVLTSHLVAATTVLAAAAIQTRGLFTNGGEQAARRRSVPLPRLSVVVYWTVPYFWYGTAYFAFLFADRLTAGTAMAALADTPFSVPAQYSLGMELALLTLLVSASGVEVAGALFARAIGAIGSRPFSGDQAPFEAAMRRHHRRALALSIGTFVAIAGAVASLGHRMFAGELTSTAWFTLLRGDIGYACLTVGVVNALVLFQMRRTWDVLHALAPALLVNLGTGYVLGHALGSTNAVYGLILGAAYFAAASTRAARRVLRHPDYTYAAGW